LDPYFVRDLQESFLREVQSRLGDLTAATLEEVSNLEKQCARLMTLLRPIYARCGIPSATPPKQSQLMLAKFIEEGRGEVVTDGAGAAPASSSGISIQQVTLETAKLLILRARRTFLREQREENLNDITPHASFNVDVLLKHGIEVQGVLQLINAQLRGMCEAYGEEYAGTLQDLVTTRIEHIKHFRYQLIHSLVSRKIHTAEDVELWRRFKVDFRVANVTDPFIIDCRVGMCM
jgi:hypothetical protein